MYDHLENEDEQAITEGNIDLGGGAHLDYPLENQEPVRLDDSENFKEETKSESFHSENANQEPQKCSSVQSIQGKGTINEPIKVTLVKEMGKDEMERVS